jgi:hypothetical protein
MAVEAVRGYGRQSRHYLRTLLAAVWRYQLVARNSYGTFECCSRTSHHLSFLPREVAGKVDMDAFLNALGAVGLPASCGLELWACARGQMTCAASLFGIIEERVQEPYISGTSGCPAKLSSRKAQPVGSPLSFPFTLHQLTKNCLSFKGIWSKFDRIA